MTQQFLKSFDIFLDTQSKKDNLSYFKKLTNAVSEKLSKIKHRPSTVAAHNILKMYKEVQKDPSYGSTVRVLNHDFDHKFIRSDWTRERSKKEYNLMKDFEQLVKLLSSYCEQPKEDEYEIEITFEMPKPKRLKKVTTYEKITILERWVKIGYKMYRRQFDCFSGDEYIIVDGDVYNIKHDRYGREYLA